MFDVVLNAYFWINKGIKDKKREENILVNHYDRT